MPIQLISQGQLHLLEQVMTSMCHEQTGNDAESSFDAQYTVVVVGEAGRTGKEYEATIQSTDTSHDLAVLKIDAPPGALKPIKVFSHPLPPPSPYAPPPLLTVGPSPCLDLLWRIENRTLQFTKA